MSCKPMHKLYHLLYHIGMPLTWHTQNRCFEKTPPIQTFHMSFDNNFQTYYHCSQVCTLIFDVSKHFFSISKFFEQCKWSFSAMDGPLVLISFFKQAYCNMFGLPICKKWNWQQQSNVFITNKHYPKASKTYKFIYLSTNLGRTFSVKVFSKAKTTCGHNCNVKPYSQIFSIFKNCKRDFVTKITKSCIWRLGNACGP
jgi:hypothetical protein